MSHRRVRPLAAIDVGTNTVLLLLAEPRGSGAFRVLEDRAIITRLGRGVDAAGRLAPDAVATTLAAVRGFALRARECDARVRAVGTSALRDATNRDDFLVPAQALLGVPVEIADGAREATLTFAGALHGLDLANATLVDIGGGSTELARRVDGTLRVESLDIGAVLLTERHRLSVPTPTIELDRVRTDARAALARSRVVPRSPLVATAGTATTLAAIVHRVVPYDGARVHGSSLTYAQLIAQRDALAAMSLAQRRDVPGLSPGREDVIVTGATILASVLEIADADRVTVSDGGLRTGLMLEMLAERAD